MTWTMARIEGGAYSMRTNEIRQASIDEGLIDEDDLLDLDDLRLFVSL